jgi:hypothetical protein
MSGMQNIETAICERDAPAFLTGGLEEGRGVIPR